MRSHVRISSSIPNCNWIVGLLDKENIFEIINSQRNFDENLSNFVVITVPADIYIYI